jgi:hypothetical protein
MLDAIAFDWLTSRGTIGAAERDILATETDEALAHECIEGWNLNERSGDTEYDTGDELKDSHMDEQSYTEADLVAAFERLREAVAAGKYDED